MDCFRRACHQARNDVWASIIPHSFSITCIRGALDGVRDDIREIEQRAGNLENQYASMSNRLDQMDVRIERIGRRLDLTDA